MFQSAPANDNRQASLSSDDVAFVSALYPAVRRKRVRHGVRAGDAESGGLPIRGGLVTVVNPANGITVSGLTGLSDGTFNFQAPVGDYLVYVEPLGGYVLPGNLYLSDTAVDTDFQSFFLGGTDSPTHLSLTLGPNSDLICCIGARRFRCVPGSPISVPGRRELLKGPPLI